MTLHDAATLLRAYGMTLKCRDGEYRVNYRGGSEVTAYYTDDRHDAVMTGVAMAHGS
jgi:hypothetical protein